MTTIGSSSYVDIPDILSSSVQQNTSKDHSISQHLLNVQPSHSSNETDLLHSISTQQYTQQCALQPTTNSPPPLEEVSTHDDTNNVEEQMISDLLVQSSFSNSLIAQSAGDPMMTQSQAHLNNLFDDEMKRFENISDEHWKYPEYPLARIKKIMKMDEEVRMISGEVPILLSKAIEIFVTELTLRSWIYTEETKRRTIQRSDIAMAVAKNDMFDFLIDIVPREEIQTKNGKYKDPSLPSSLNETSSVSGEGGSGGLLNLSPDLLQAYIQLLSQQAEEEEIIPTKDGEDPTQSVANLAATSQLMQQQLNILQQLAAHSQQQQQQHEEQQQTHLDTATSTLTHHTTPVYTQLDSSNIIGSSSSTGSNVLIPPDQFATPHEHSTTDIVTLLSSKSMEQLPDSSNSSQYLTSSTGTSFGPSLLNEDSVKRVIIQSERGEGSLNNTTTIIPNTSSTEHHLIVTPYTLEHAYSTNNNHL